MDARPLSLHGDEENVAIGTELRYDNRKERERGVVVNFGIGIAAIK